MRKMTGILTCWIRWTKEVIGLDCVSAKCLVKLAVKQRTQAKNRINSVLHHVAAKGQRYDC